MAKIIIPNCNPVPLYQVDAPEVPGKNFIHLDEDFFWAQIRQWEQKIVYFQKWQLTDTVCFQIQSEIDPLKLDLIDCTGKVYKTWDFELKPTVIVGQPWNTYEVKAQLADGEPGYYYFRLTVGFGDTIMQFISEPQDIQLSHPETMLYSYYSTMNYLDVIFATGMVFNFRCESIITDYQPGVDSVSFVNQRHNTVLLSAYLFDSFTLKIGYQYGVANWVVKRLNYVFACNVVEIENKGYVRADGAKFESKRVELYPLQGWALAIEAANNTDSQYYDLTPTKIIAMTYNIQTPLFGDINGLPSNSQLIILERK